MYKTLGLLMLGAFGVSASVTDAVVVKQPSSVPVVVEAKQHQPNVSSARKKREKTPEQFNTEKETKVSKLKQVKEKILTLQDKVDPSEKGWLDLKLKCADKWIEAIGKYQSTDTKLYRSFTFANRELTTAHSLAALKPSSHVKKSVYPEKDITKLEARFNEVKAHASQLVGDNQIAFNVMIECANEYITALKATKAQPVPVRPFLSQAMKYVNTAEMFAQNRIPHH